MTRDTVGRSAQPDTDRKLAVVPGGKRRIGYFTVMSGLLLAFVLVGFSRTFYLRPFGELSPLSGPLHVHGAVLTAWFLLLFVQALLVRSRNVRLHRRLGVAGAVVAISVVAAGSWILALRDAPYVNEVPGRGFGNLMSLVAFALCVGAGILLRRRPPAHRRLMLLGSIIITGPALDRIARLQPLNDLSAAVLPDVLGSPEVGIAIVGTLSLILTVLLHDLVRQRRLHLATIWGILCIFALAPAVTSVLIKSGIWPAFVRFVS
jgi:hypothetical protein